MVTLLMNLAILTPPFLLAVFYPQVGTIAGLLGGFSTMLVVYFLPIVTYLKFRHSSITNPEVAQLIKRSTFVPSPMASDDSPAKEKSPNASPMNSILEVTHEATASVVMKDYGSEASRKRTFYIGCIVGVVLCSYSVYSFFLQVKGLF